MALGRSAAEIRNWLEKYEPVEREILEARARRLDNAAKRRMERYRRFGDLCEATEGLAVKWRRAKVPIEEQFAWADGDIWTLQCLLRYHRRAATRRVDRIRHAIKRPLYYAAENERRRKAAVERRQIRRRTTGNPCPTREEILEAWVHRRDSHAAAIRFGGLIEDLECYLDNSLRFNEGGTIIGRNGGVKRWLQEEIPALYLRYTTVMRYKAASRKLRQIAGVSDPVSSVDIVRETSSGKFEIETSASRFCDMSQKRPATLVVERARAIWREVTEGVADNPTALFMRLDALLDPERIEDANMLACWRRKHNANSERLKPK